MTRALLALLAAFAAPAAALDWSERDWLPSSKELIRPFEADPKELGYQLRWSIREGGKPVSEIGMGDYLGIVRVPVGRGWVGQLNLGGGVIARFDTSRPTRDFEVADFSIVLPFDFRKDKHAVRAAIWHISSHVGDDFVARTGAVIDKHYTDELLLAYAYHPTVLTRVYAVGARAFQITPGFSRKRGQLGFELGNEPFWNERAQFVFSTNLDWYERRGDNVGVSVRAGVRLADVQRVGAATVFVGCYDGPLYYQYRYPERERQFTMGLKIEMGNPIPDAAPLVD